MQKTSDNKRTLGSVIATLSASALAVLAFAALSAFPMLPFQAFADEPGTETSGTVGSFEIGDSTVSEVDDEGFPIDSVAESNTSGLSFTTQAAGDLRTSAFSNVMQAKAHYQDVVLAGAARGDEKIDISSCGFYSDSDSDYSPNVSCRFELEELFEKLTDEDFHPELFCTLGCATVVYDMGDGVRPGEDALAPGCHRYRFTYLAPYYHGRGMQTPYPADQVKAMCKQLDDKARQILAGAPKTGGDAAKAKYVHDWLIANVKYSLVQRGKDYFPASAYGAIVDGRASCMGYSRANKYLLDRLGIECSCVSNTPANQEGHEWNRVKVGGAWYNEDVTWDDPASHQYFLRSDKWWRKEAAKEDNQHAKWQPAGVAGTSSIYDGKVKWASYVKTSIAGAVVELDSKKVRYNSKYRIPDIVDVFEPIDNIDLEEGVDYTVSYKKAKLGRAYATITGKGYYGGKLTTSVNIVKRDISTVYTDKYKIPTQTYTGKAIKPVKARKIETFDEFSYDYGTYKLKEGHDYTVSYRNNVKPGTATVVIKGKGGFKGTVTKTFKIVKPKSKKGK